MTAAKRLARLESALARPPEAAPVDMTAFWADLDFLLAGSGHKGRNALARAVCRGAGRVRGEALALGRHPMTAGSSRACAAVFRGLSERRLTMWPARSLRNSLRTNSGTDFAASALPSTGAAGCRFVGCGRCKAFKRRREREAF